MHLVQVFLPMYDNAKRHFPSALYVEVRDELVDKFGGITVHSRAPARGLWQEDENAPVRDDLVIYEVMIDQLDEAWWGQYRRTLEVRFRQQSLVVRAHEIRLL